MRSGAEPADPTPRRQVFPGLHVNYIVDFGCLEGPRRQRDRVRLHDVDHRYYNVWAWTISRRSISSLVTRGGRWRCSSRASATRCCTWCGTRQDFIRWAKDQYGIDNLIANRDKLLRIFGANTQTDHNLHTTDGLINLFNLVAF